MAARHGVSQGSKKGLDLLDSTLVRLMVAVWQIHYSHPELACWTRHDLPSPLLLP